MKLMTTRRQQRETRDVQGRLAALEDYVDYLREQGEYGFSQAGKRLDALDGGKDGKKHG